MRARQLLDQSWMARVPGMRAWLGAQLNNRANNATDNTRWTARRVLDRVVNITEAEIVRLRALLDPPDLMLTPEVGHIGLIEFYRAKEAITAGRRAAEEILPELLRLAEKKRHRRAEQSST